MQTSYTQTAEDRNSSGSNDKEDKTEDKPKIEPLDESKEESSKTDEDK